MKHKLAIFASGAGSNALNILQYFKDHSQIEILLIVTNNPQAGVLAHARKFDVKSMIVDRTQFKSAEFVDVLREQGIDFIVLAGFLWLIPSVLVRAFDAKIVNIHPALLPKYGGKGMYGMHVHQAVVDQKEPETGITIHYVNEHYDEGQIIFQASTPLTPEDTPEMVAQKVHNLEYMHFPRIIEQCLSQ